MKVKEMISKFKNADEYRIICKCGNLELCGEYEVESVEIKYDLAVITINKPMEEIYAYRAIEDISAILTYGEFSRSDDIRKRLYEVLELLKEVGEID